MDWQPIETAPRDGTRFIAYPCYVPLQYDDESGDWYDSYGDEHVPIGFELFTHWMPLPNPPKEQPNDR